MGYFVCSARGNDWYTAPSISAGYGFRLCASLRMTTFQVRGHVSARHSGTVSSTMTLSGSMSRFCETIRSTHITNSWPTMCTRGSPRRPGAFAPSSPIPRGSADSGYACAAGSSVRRSARSPRYVWTVAARVITPVKCCGIRAETSTSVRRLQERRITGIGGKIARRGMLYSISDPANLTQLI